jgi:phage portal protein BeeE
MWPFSKRSQPIEKRSAMSGFTAELIQAREAYISGRTGFAELTATAQSCISLWENGFTLADVEGTDLLECDVMALLGRSLAVRGESVWLIGEDRLIPCSDWDLRTKFADPVAYRISIPEVGGGTTMTVLAGEVLHVRIGADVAAPWFGVSPLRRSRLTAEMLHNVESAIQEVFENAPLGSQVVPMPEVPDTDNTAMSRSFRGQRGRVLLRESVAVSAAGGPTPQVDWSPSSLSPDMQKSMSVETLAASRDGILAAFGVLPGLFNPATHGPMVREAQRHLAQWTLQPIAQLIADECTDKLGTEVTIDTQRPLHAFDAGGRARAMLAVAQAMAMAKAGDISPADLQAALALVDWGD